MTFLDARPSARGARLIEAAGALTKPEWLPDATGWEGLDDLAAEHRRLLAARSGAGSRREELLRHYAAEDADHARALRESFRPGGGDELPTVTPPGERTAALRDAADRLQAANDVLDEFLAETVASIEGAAPEWIGTLSEQREDAGAKRRDAARLLAEAERAELRLARLEQWVKRNAGLHERAGFRIAEMRFVTWPFIEESFTPARAPELDSHGEPFPQYIDPPELPYAGQRRIDRALEFDQAHSDPDEPTSEEEALRRAIENAPDPDAARRRRAFLTEQAATFDNDTRIG